MNYNIYLISATLPDNVIQWKVGVSKHPNKRIKELQTANPNRLDIVALYTINEKDIAYNTETLIHSFLKDFKINGEWFVSYSLNIELFFIYCDKYVEVAKTLKIIEENKKWK